MSKKAEKDPNDGEYIGNIFGWRISLIGLAVLLFFLSVIVYRHYTMEIPPGFQMEEEERSSPDSDSLLNQDG